MSDRTVWLDQWCPECGAAPGARCSRWSRARRVGGARVAVVPFWGRAGRGGQTERIDLLRVECERLVEVERWTSRAELCYALEAPAWERFGTFAGLPLTQGEVIWTAADRPVLIRGRRGGRTFEEFVC